ncbi:hypothetical protein BG011_002548 [Mortierella polycephala]|uniref:Mss4-like protein n=1 Tax=Mortierella polycephala TaxID=41804 RepID=A0A9P6Q694_9FUNG|nr:hypothetical protein BG011_002548 [Mortierella polycephala]
MAAVTSRNPGKPYTEFQEQDLIQPHADNQVNLFDIYCPQEVCRCKLLLAKAATQVQREKSKLVLPKLPLAGPTISTIEESPENQKSTDEKAPDSNNSATADVNAEGQDNAPQSTEELQSFWRVTDMMAFENIGFSKKLPNGIQFLSCADCDTGPLGFYDSNALRTNKEYLIALNRVRYHDRS